MKFSRSDKRKGDSEPKDQKEKVPVLKGEDEITSIKDYTENSFDDGWKYIYGINPTNKTIVKDNLIIKKTNDGNAFELEQDQHDEFVYYAQDMPFYPFFTLAIYNIIVTLDYYREYLGNKALVLVSHILNAGAIQWFDEAYKNRITLLKDDFEQVVDLINNMSLTSIDLDTVTDFYDINKALVEGNYKPYVTRVSIEELFNLYKIVRSQKPSGCYKFLNYESIYPFRVNGVDLEIYKKHNADYKDAYLSYFVPKIQDDQYHYIEQPYEIWYCNEYKVLPQVFTDKGKTIEFEENGETKEYYKVIMVKGEHNRYYSMLYFDWGDYDVEEFLKFDPESIEPKKLTPATYYFYMKFIYDHICGISKWIMNGNYEPGENNNQYKKFATLLQDYKNNFDSTEVYALYKVELYLYEYILKVGNYLIENIETIKSFYTQRANESDDSYISRITGGILYFDNNKIVIYQDYHINIHRERLNLLGTIDEGVFTYTPENVGPGDGKIGGSDIEYFSYLVNDYYHEVEKPDNHKPYIESIGEYTSVMDYIYLNQNDNSIIMSVNEITTEEKEDIESYTKYTITN